MISKLEDILSGRRTVGIAGHVKPDGDCVGACLGVYNYLKIYHPEIRAFVYLEEIPESFRFLSGAEDIIHTTPEREPHSLFICLDCGDVKRLGENAGYFEKAEHTLCIDHHVSNSSFAEENYIFPDASSTCELIYDLLDQERITKAIAECLYLGIVHDTGVFQYSCTHRSTMEAAGFLMERGIPFSRIVDNTYYEKTLAENRAMGTALNNAMLHLSGRVISAIIRQKEMDEKGFTKRDMEGVVQQLRSTKGVESSILLYQTGEDEFKLSLRSTEIIDCAAITVEYGGGGHVRAAGATLIGDPEKALAEILPRMEKQLQESGAAV